MQNTNLNYLTTGGIMPHKTVIYDRKENFCDSLLFFFSNARFIQNKMHPSSIFHASREKYTHDVTMY